MTNRSAAQRVRAAAAVVAMWLVATGYAPAWAAGEVPRVVSIDSLLSTYRLPEGTSLKSLAIGQMSQASVNVLQTRTGVRAHYHAQSDEVLYVLTGRGVLRMAPNGATIKAKDLAAMAPVRLKPGVVILMPRGTAHMIDVQGDDPLVILSVFAPVFHGEDRIAVQE